MNPNVSYPAGRLRLFKSVWEEISKDEKLLSWIEGYKIPFHTLPTQRVTPPNQHWSPKESKNISTSVMKLLELGAVTPCNSKPDQFISSIFLVPKPNGSYRFILNLKKLNTFITTQHFKMEDFRTAKRLITHKCFMSTLDLQDAYFLISIHPDHRKYLRFRFDNQIYEFTCLPFGLSTAPYVFTKILKPVVNELREAGLISVVYLDDFLLIGHTYQTCQDNVSQTIDLLSRLGFLINKEKSHLIPSYSRKFLGFVFNSNNMIFEITLDKKLDLYSDIKKFSITKSCKIRDFARFTGKITAACPAVTYGWAYTKNFEKEKLIALEHSKQNYDCIMKIPAYLQEDFVWWKNNIRVTQSSLDRLNKFELEIFSDASLSGWGAVCGKEKAHGHWSELEKLKHINILELLAAFFGLKCFATNKSNCDILLRIDNTTAISYINRMGGIQCSELSQTSKRIWQWCEERNNLIFASYISSSDNLEADIESRKLEKDTEWELAPFAYKQIIRKFGNPDIDLFASRNNKKCELYISWLKDPDSMNTDAFTICWENYFFYAFPPFSIILRALQKIQNSNCRGIMVVPYWPSQPWFPLFNLLLESELITFKPNINLLVSNSRVPHALHHKLTLVAGILSSRHTN